MGYQDSSVTDFKNEQPSKPVGEQQIFVEKTPVSAVISETLKENKLIKTVTENSFYFLFGAIVFVFSICWYEWIGPEITESFIPSLNDVATKFFSAIFYLIFCGIIYFLFIKELKTHGQGPAIFLFFIVFLIIFSIDYYQDRDKRIKASDEQKIAIEDGYYEKAKKIVIPELADIKASKERQKLISILSQKVDLLAKASQHTSRHKAEYKLWRERLEFERVLVEYEAMWGPAKKVELTEVGEWIPVCTIKNRQRINYLSKHKFKEKDNTNRENVWKKAVNKKYSYRLSGSREIHVEFKMFKKSTNVYYWTSDS